jgi:hypothetical protein
VPDDEQPMCEAGGEPFDEDRFRAYLAGEISDPICDDCLTAQRDAADADRAGAAAWYCH